MRIKAQLLLCFLAAVSQSTVVFAKNADWTSEVTDWLRLAGKEPITIIPHIWYWGRSKFWLDIRVADKWQMIKTFSDDDAITLCRCPGGNSVLLRNDRTNVYGAVTHVVYDRSTSVELSITGESMQHIWPDPTGGLTAIACKDESWAVTSYTKDGTFLRTQSYDRKNLALASGACKYQLIGFYDERPVLWGPDLVVLHNKHAERLNITAIPSGSLKAPTCVDTGEHYNFSMLQQGHPEIASLITRW